MLKGLPSAVCEGAFPDDDAFPQLKIASDPALMLEVFRAHGFAQAAVMESAAT